MSDDSDSDDSDSDDDSNTVVIDNGSSTIKAGFAGDDEPRAVFSTIIGATNAEYYYIGDEAQERRAMLSMRYPLQNGIINDWDDMEKIWQHMFDNELCVEPEESNCLISEHYFNPEAHSEKMTQIMFETFNVPNLYMSDGCVLSLYVTGRTTGVVLDCGESVTLCAPFYEGYLLKDGIRRMDVAGGEVTNCLQNLISKKQKIKFEIIADIKEKLGFVALDPDEHALDNEKLYELPDGQVIEIGDERFKCFEPLFQPGFLNIANFVYSSITKGEYDVRKDLLGNVCICGGTAMTEGFSDRLQKQLDVLAPSSTKVKVVTQPDWKYSVFSGGSILASLSSFEEQWLAKDEYDDYGPSIIWERCPNIYAAKDKDMQWGYIAGIGLKTHSVRDYGDESKENDMISKVEYDTLSDEKDGLQSKVDDLVKQNGTLKQDNDTLQAENDELQLRTNEMMKENERMKQNDDRSQKQTNDLQSRLDEVVKDNSDIQNKYNDLQSSMDEVVKEKETMKQNNDILQSRLDKLVKENGTLKNQNTALNEECKEVKMELNELKVKHDELRKNRKLDLTKYMEWSQDDVLHWILGLNDGQFGKYESTLTNTFAEQDFDGSCLEDVLKSDIQDWGVKNFKDKTTLYKNIRQLVDGTVHNKSNLNEGGNITAYL